MTRQKDALKNIEKDDIYFRMNKENYQIVLLDDQEDTLLLLEHLLKSQVDCDIITFTDPEESILYIKETPNVDLLCTDLLMPKIDGFEVIKRINQLQFPPRIVVITASDHLSDALSAVRAGAFDYIVKPIKAELFSVSVNRALSFARLEKEKNLYMKDLEKVNARNEKELKMGRKIQRQMLPQGLPSLQNFCFGLKYIPSNRIGGDFFDFLYYREPTLVGLWLADVSGHGIPAALLTMLLKSEMRTAMRDPANIDKNIYHVNNRLESILPSGKFASAFLMLIDDEKRKITYCKASQEPGLLLKKDETVIELVTDGILLGSFGSEFIDKRLSFQCKTMCLDPGDRIVLYTDGVTEASNDAGEMFTRERLVEDIKRNSRMPVLEMCDKISNDVLEFTGKKHFFDDFSLIIITVR